jgi:hypothetical protein
MTDAPGNPFREEIELSQGDRDLIRAYRSVNRSVDELAYTPDFDRLYDLYSASGHKSEKHDVFRRLLILRKSALLPRLLRPAESSSA